MTMARARQARSLREINPGLWWVPETDYVVVADTREEAHALRHITITPDNDENVVRCASDVWVIRVGFYRHRYVVRGTGYDAELLRQRFNRQKETVWRKWNDLLSGKHHGN
jgi:hypothetical protein